MPPKNLTKNDWQMTDRPGQSAYEIFNIEHSFQYFKFWPSALKESSVLEHQTWVPCAKCGLSAALTTPAMRDR